MRCGMSRRETRTDATRRACFRQMKRDSTEQMPERIDLLQKGPQSAPRLLPAFANQPLSSNHNDVRTSRVRYSKPRMGGASQSNFQRRDHPAAHDLSPAFVTAVLRTAAAVLHQLTDRLKEAARPIAPEQKLRGQRFANGRLGEEQQPIGRGTLEGAADRVGDIFAECGCLECGFAGAVRNRFAQQSSVRRNANPNVHRHKLAIHETSCT